MLSKNAFPVAGLTSIHILSYWTRMSISSSTTKKWL
jgi:hypothetical protein